MNSDTVIQYIQLAFLNALQIFIFVYILCLIFYVSKTTKMNSTESRFSLLLLEPYEIYFEDFFVDMVEYNESSVLEGKLKICSKSIVFETKQIEKPLIKISYKDCLEINNLEGDNKIMRVVTQQHVEMLDGNIIAPFKFRNKNKTTFTFILKYVSIEECLPKIQQLKRASTLPIHEQNSMIATIAFSWHNRISFDRLWFENIYEKIIIESTVNNIKPLVTNPGRLLLTNHLLYYQSFNNIQKKPVLKINLSNIVHLIKRRFMLRQIGLEIVYNDESQKVLYVAFICDEMRDKFYDAIFQQENFISDDFNCDSMIIKWQHGEISNYDYLLYLNSIADRSFNDLTNYPVFPWILKDYTSDKIDLQDIKVYRNLQKPIGALNENRLGRLKERCTEMDEPKYLYGSMFSAPGLIIFYLARTYPELMLCLQNGKFDHPDRVFNSIADTFNNCMTNMSDFKELIPEFYDPNKCDFLVNKKKINFGQRWDGSIVNDVELPPWAQKSPEKFIKTLRTALESDYVSANINSWIDLIFGYKQRGEEALKADNLFYHLCYEGSVNLCEVSDMAAKHALEVQILEFGQIPKQLFTTPHPQKIMNIKTSLINSVAKNFNTQLIKTLDGFRDEILSLTCSDELLIATGKDGSLKCYNMVSNKQIRNVQVSDFPLSACVKFRNSSQIICSSWDNTILTYSLDYGKVCEDFEAHDAHAVITCLKGIRIQDTNYIISGSTDCYVKIWKWMDEEVNISKHCKLMDCLAVDDKINCIDVKAQDKLITTMIGCKNGDIIQWHFSVDDINERKIDKVKSGESECVNQLKFHNSGLTVAACFKSRIMLIDCLTTMTLFSFSKNHLTCLEWLSDYIIIGDTTGMISILDLKIGNIVHCFESHNSINCILYVKSKVNRLIVSSGTCKDNVCIKLWRIDQIDQ